MTDRPGLALSPFYTYIYSSSCGTCGVLSLGGVLVNQVADIFTKPLDPTTFLKFRNVLLNYGRADAHP